MKQLQIISIMFLMICLYLIGCLDTFSSTLDSDATNTSDIHVLIFSDLKTLYVSTPKETTSLKLCFAKDCKDEDKKEFSNPKEVNGRQLFGISYDESFKYISIERFSDDQFKAIRKISLDKEDKYIINPEGVELSKDEIDMITEVNKYREKNGRSILIVSKRLMDGARAQSQKMKVQGQSHWLYPSNGANAENIFVSATTVQQAMYGGGYALHGFTQSPGHNANILNGSFKYIGIGNVPNQTYGCWTQRFSY